MVHLARPLPLLLTLLLALGLALTTAPPAQAQTPAATVEDDGGNVVLRSYTGGALLAPDQGAASGDIPAEGAGARLMWYPGQKAFRAGEVGVNKDGTQWDADNIGEHSVAFGVDTEASGDGAVAMGDGTTANDADATAMGDGTRALGPDATAMGNNTEASDKGATAMGLETTASFDAATAMGRKTTASADAATAMGFETTASDPNATAMGFETTASGFQATAMGLETTAATDNSLSIGEYNSANTSSDNTLFVAGNGSSSGRSDALVLDQDGNLSIEGVFNADLGTYAGHLQGSKDQREGDDPTAHIALIENTSTGSDADGLAIQAGPTTDPGQGVNYISFFDGDGDSNGDVEGNGSGGVVYETSGNDYAEELPVAKGATVPEATDLVGVRGGKIRLDTEGADRVMVASRAPAVTGNTTPSDATDDARRVAVAFVGQVPARVRGKAEVGDLIVASGQDDGTARAVSPKDYRRGVHGPIAGQAWEAKAAEEVGEVTVAVGLGQSGPVAKRLEEQQAQIDSLEKQVRQIESMEERLVALEQGRTAPTRWVGASWTSRHGGLLIAFLLGGLLGAGLLATRRS